MSHPKDSSLARTRYKRSHRIPARFDDFSEIPSEVRNVIKKSPFHPTISISNGVRFGQVSEDSERPVVVLENKKPSTSSSNYSSSSSTTSSQSSTPAQVIKEESKSTTPAIKHATTELAELKTPTKSTLSSATTTPTTKTSTPSPSSSLSPALEIDTNTPVPTKSAETSTKAASSAKRVMFSINTQSTPIVAISDSNSSPEKMEPTSRLSKLPPPESQSTKTEDSSQNDICDGFTINVNNNLASKRKKGRGQSLIKRQAAVVSEMLQNSTNKKLDQESNEARKNCPCPSCKEDDPNHNHETCYSCRKNRSSKFSRKIPKVEQCGVTKLQFQPGFQHPKSNTTPKSTKIINNKTITPATTPVVSLTEHPAINPIDLEWMNSGRSSNNIQSTPIVANLNQNQQMVAKFASYPSYGSRLLLNEPIYLPSNVATIAPITTTLQQIAEQARKPPFLSKKAAAYLAYQEERKFNDMTKNFAALVKITKYLEVKDLLNLRLVNKSWKSIVDSDAVWNRVRLERTEINNWTEFGKWLCRYKTKDLHVFHAKEFHVSVAKVSEALTDTKLDRLCFISDQAYTNRHIIELMCLLNSYPNWTHRLKILWQVKVEVDDNGLALVPLKRRRKSTIDPDLNQQLYCYNVYSDWVFEREKGCKRKCVSDVKVELSELKDLFNNEINDRSSVPAERKPFIDLQAI